MRKGIGTALILLGAALIIGAVGLTVRNFRQDDRAGQAARESLSRLVQSIPLDNEAHDEMDAPPLILDRGEPELFEVYPYMDMPEQEVDGRMYIGVLEIPSLELELPILSQWDDADSNIAPCRYSGSAYQKDMVIAGHNYVNHFWSLQSLSIGDEVIFTDVDGNVFRYAMVDIEILKPHQVEQMCTGDWDLTLFTCTVGAGERIAIRCEETE